MSVMMSQSLFAALAVFGAVMAFTPGPNNIMVLSSGLTYGFRRSRIRIISARLAEPRERIQYEGKR